MFHSVVHRPLNDKRGIVSCSSLFRFGFLRDKHFVLLPSCLCIFPFIYLICHSPCAVLACSVFFCCGSSKLLRQLTIRSIKTIFRFTKCVCVCVWCVQRDFSMLTAELCMCARCYTCFKVWYVRGTQLRAGTIVAIEIQDNSGSNQKSNEIFVALT